MEKKLLDFGDFDLIFKIRPALWMSNFDKESLFAPFLLNQMMDSGPEYCTCVTGKIKRID